MIVDFHTHILPPEFQNLRSEFINIDATFSDLLRNPTAKIATAEDLIEAMDRDGVDVSVIMGFGWTDHGVARASNDYIINSVAKYPTRLRGFAGINPSWGDIAIDEVERCADAGLLGIGEMHPDTQQFDLGSSTFMQPLMEIVHSLELMVTTHCSEPVGHSYGGKGTVRPEVLWQFIQAFPNATIICAHWGGGLPFYALMPEVRKSLQNVYFDTAASPFLYDKDVFQVVASLIGVEQILFASDYPVLNAGRLIRQLETSGLAQDKRDAIAYGNATRLLKLQITHTE
ncbi:amidohydrolase family protein [Dehalococcoidia bacterium]|nr:amidohydrolase family protein [Dehalococcoidia bacterium]